MDEHDTVEDFPLDEPYDYTREDLPGTQTELVAIEHIRDSARLARPQTRPETEAEPLAPPPVIKRTA